MAENTKIQWTDDTWNPWHGCKKVSAGCKFCYLFREKERYKQDPKIVLRSKTKFYAPLGWKEPRLVFTCSWSDWFIDAADEWRNEAWAIIKRTPHITYQILTKRPERIKDHLPADWGEEGYSNVWIGVTIENQKAVVSRMKYFKDFPARVKFISVEPLLENVCLFLNGAYKGLVDWVIVGGESGNETGKYRYRKCTTSWIEDVVKQTVTAGIPVFVKQLGTFMSKKMKLSDRHGGDISEWSDLPFAIRQMPNNYLVPQKNSGK
ncbi:MAG TPA: DUF5131 family protein [Cyclobacteriaceae bacterium]|jgi:protein gp37|nr:DUF5131 family protein [Cyclobacteriaceae bacterium]